MLGPACWTLALPLLLGGLQDEPAWKPYVSRDGRFTVTFPTLPAEERQRVKTATGMLDVAVFLAEGWNDTSYVVSYSDLPEEDAKADTLTKRLDFAREGAVSKARGRLRSEKAIDLASHPGRELVIENDTGLVIRVRLYAVGRRLYQIMAVGPGSAALARDGTFFLDSFRLAK